MTDETCSTCAYKSDGVNTRTPDYCYCLDKTVGLDEPACPEWRSSLRDEPVLGPIGLNVARLLEVNLPPGPTRPEKP